MLSGSHCGHGTLWPHHSHGCGQHHSPNRRWRSYSAPADACFYDPNHCYHRHDWYLDDRDLPASDHPYNYNNDNYWTAAAAAADYESDNVQPSAPADVAAEDISTSNKASGSRVELAVRATKKEDSNVKERIDRVVEVVERLAAKVDEIDKKMEEKNIKEK